MSDDWQTLHYSGISGPTTVQAPAGWDFDSTQTKVWLWLCSYTRERINGSIKTQREMRFADGKIEALSLILANTLGMALPYWQGQAKIAVLGGHA